MRGKYLVPAALAALVVAVPPAATATPTPERGQTESMEVFSPDGSIFRAEVSRPASDRAPAANRDRAASKVVPFKVNGPSASKFDLVFVGDGYTANQQDLFGRHVSAGVARMFQVEPFRSYGGQFNIWQVNVVSAESGVDNDPWYGVRRNTALDMYFWCGNIERLLCVNETKAKQYAAAAPDVDQVVALANTTKYGGAGGSVATSSGGNASSADVVVHELGHSIGGLADEYENGTCDPREPREPNATTRTAAQLAANREKWYRWLGQPSPDGGVVSTYQGARYCTSGMYRPSPNSVMRTLGQQFNPPGTEAMIAGFYREAATIDGAAALPDGRLRVTVAHLPHPATITWAVDGEPVASGVTEFDPRRLPHGRHTVTVTVTDATGQVRDRSLRRALSDSRSWQVVR